jgi:hypothetical protein
VKVVEEVFRRTSPIWHVHAAGQIIRTTGEHPFFAYNKGWVKAGLLEIGDRLLSHDGQWVTVEDVLDTGEWEVVYNLRIADYHTYFVTDWDWGFSVWAHNACVVVHQWASGARPSANHYSIDVVLDNGTTVSSHQSGGPGGNAQAQLWTNPNGYAQVGHNGTISITNGQAVRADAFVTAQIALPPQPYNVYYRSCQTYVWDVLTAARVTQAPGAGPLPPRPIVDDVTMANQDRSLQLGLWLRHLTED